MEREVLEILSCTVMLCSAFAKIQRLCHGPHPWSNAGMKPLTEQGESSNGEEKKQTTKQPSRDCRDQGENLLEKPPNIIDHSKEKTIGLVF